MSHSVADGIADDTAVSTAVGVPESAPQVPGPSYLNGERISQIGVARGSLDIFRRKSADRDGAFKAGGEAEEGNLPSGRF